MPAVKHMVAICIIAICASFLLFEKTIYEIHDTTITNMIAIPHSCVRNNFKLLILIITTLLSYCKCAKSNVEVPLLTTSDPAVAQLIYLDHGIDDENYLCQNIDEKTSRIHGSAICNRISTTFAPPIHFSGRAVCEFISLPKSKRGKGKCFPNRSPKCKYKVVGCYSYYSTPDFYVVNAEHNFYYAIRRYDQIVGCFQIDIQESDYPKIELKDTVSKYEADDMFGIYGTLPLTDSNHVCAKSANNPDRLVGQQICTNIFETTDYGRGEGQFLRDIPVKCTDRKLTRQIKSPVTRSNKESASISMVVCWYKNYSTPKRFMVVNSPNINYYYITKEDKNHKMWIEAVLYVGNKITN